MLPRSGRRKVLSIGSPHHTFRSMRDQQNNEIPTSRVWTDLGELILMGAFLIGAAAFFVPIGMLAYSGLGWLRNGSLDLPPMVTWVAEPSMGSYVGAQQIVHYVWGQWVGWTIFFVGMIGAYAVWFLSWCCYQIGDDLSQRGK